MTKFQNFLIKKVLGIEVDINALAEEVKLLQSVKTTNAFPKKIKIPAELGDTTIKGDLCVTGDLSCKGNVTAFKINQE